MSTVWCRWLCVHVIREGWRHTGLLYVRQLPRHIRAWQEGPHWVRSILVSTARRLQNATENIAGLPQQCHTTVLWPRDNVWSVGERDGHRTVDTYGSFALRNKALQGTFSISTKLHLLQRVFRVASCERISVKTLFPRRACLTNAPIIVNCTTKCPNSLSEWKNLCGEVWVGKWLIA
jgi:hypothetical protein